MKHPLDRRLASMSQPAGGGYGIEQKSKRWEPPNKPTINGDVARRGREVGDPPISAEVIDSSTLRTRPQAI